MGQSTDAYLFYGIELGSVDEGDFKAPWLPNWDSDGADEQDEMEWDDFYYTRVTGDQPPSTPYEEDREAHLAYWSRKGEWLKTQLVEVSSHCSCDYPIYFVHVSRLFQSAYRGRSKPLDLHELDYQVEDSDITAIEQFCNVMEIPFDRVEVGWRLASMWC